MAIPAHIARRGVAGSRGHAWFFRLAILLAVTVLVGVTASAAWFNRLVDRDARALLAADLRFQAAFPLEAFAEAHLRRPGWVFAHSREFAAMLRVPGSDRPVLVEVKAVSTAYPLRGSVDLAGGGSVAEALEGEGLVAETALLTRLGIAPGAALELGAARFVLADTLVREPDRVTRLFNLGPRVFIPLARVAQTDLLRFGSRVRHVLSLRLDDGADPETVARELEKTAQGLGIRLLTPRESQPSVRRFMRRFGVFLAMTALVTLLLAGLAMAGSMAAHLRESRRSIAILKCIGADNRLIMRLFVRHTLALALPGSVAGAVLGSALPLLIVQLVGGVFPHPPPYVPSPSILLGGLLFGLAVSLLFALGPLLWTRQVSPGALFRAASWSETLAAPGRYLWPSLLAGIALPAAGVALWSGETRMGGVLAAGLAGGLLLAFLVGRAGLFLLARLPLRGVSWRLARQGLTRPGGGYLSVIVSLGLGLGVVFAVLFLKRNLTHQIDDRLPQRAPSFFFVDIQPDQVAAFRETVRPFAVAPETTRITPVVRGRLVGIGDRRFTPEEIAAHPQSWRFTREYVLTWSEALPPGNRLLAGRWWSGPDAHEASVEKGMADRLGLRIGDGITFDIQGVPVSARVVNLRAVRWADLGLNFFVVFSPAVLQGAPVTHLATVAAAPEREEGLLAAVTGRMGNVTAIASREIMESVKGLLQKLAGAVRFLGGTAVLAGLLALSVTVAASRRRRVREAAICRLVGATRAEMSRAAAVEFGLLGALTGLAGLAVGQAITALVVGVIMDDRWQWYPEASLLAFALGAGVVFLTGLAGSHRQLGQPLRTALHDHD